MERRFILYALYSVFSWDLDIKRFDNPFGRHLLNGLIYPGLRILNRIIPKKRNQILFTSDPDFSDNSRAFFEYLNSNNIGNEYNLVWISRDEKVAARLNKRDIQAYSQKNIRWLICLFRSRYIVGCHGTYSTIKARNQIFIELWHGMPLKAVGFVDSLETKNSLANLKKVSDAKDILISTSKTTKNALISCFYMDPRKVYITGQPRNDNLYTKDARSILSDLIKRDLSQYRKIVLFTPTFRVWSEKNRIEVHTRKNNLFNFDDYFAQEFQHFIEENNLLFLLKLHPYEEEYVLSRFQPQDNVVVITSSCLQEKFIDLYHILGAVDVLITDYSSIYFDFLLLNRSILFVPTDLEEYCHSRGFAMEPYDFWTPGPKATTFRDFLRELKRCIDDPTYYESERRVVNDLINQYQDGNSCKRVLEVMRELGEDER